MRTLQHLVRAGSLVVAGLALGVSPAWSAEYFLQAEAFTMTLQGGTTTVQMWGYNKCTDPTYATCDGPSVPGPQLVVPAGDTTGLTIHLRNSLPAAGLTVTNMTSIVIPGQRENLMAPVILDDPGLSPHGDGVQRARMRSFTHETAQGATEDYVWSSLKPGTYLYHSGTHAQVQVQMGLYGSVKADAASGEAYVGQPYATDVTLLFSEIDPALHTEVAGGTYGTPNHPTSTINYQPKYFLINGAPYQPGPPATLTQTPPINVNVSVNPIPPGPRVLLRLLNAGLESHVASLLGGHFQVIAEDGNGLAYGRDQYETLLPASKTMDAIWVPAANGIYPIYDRRNRQGMLAKLEIGGVAGAPTALSDVYSMLVNVPTLTVPAKGVLLNDQNPGPNALTAVLVTSPASGVLNFNTDGSFDYTPVSGFFGQEAFTYTANNGVDSNVATVIILVNRPPVAVIDTATTQRNRAVTVNVLANDSDPDGQALTIIAVMQGASGTVTTNGTTVTYTPTTANSSTLSDTFTYTISDGQGLTPGTAIGTVNVTFNDPPIANNDSYQVAEDGGSTTVNPLSNDSDPDLPAQTLTIIAVTQPANGTVTTNGSTVTYTPAPNFNGINTFTYTISDGQTPIPGTATGTVTMTVTPVNDPPVAMPNAYQVAEDGSITFNPRTNDSDPDGQALTIIAVTQPANGTVTITNGGMTLTYTPAPNFNGIRTFTYTISDGQTPIPGTATAMVTMTVMSVNDRPVAVADAYAVNKQTLFTVPAGSGVLINDTDLDGNPLTAIQVTNLSGTVILNANGSFTYTTGAGFVGTRVFSYRVNDGLLNSTVVNVTLTKALTVSSIVSNNNNGNPIWIIRGNSTTPGSTVTVYSNGTLGGNQLGTATVGGTGTWRLDVPRTGANVSLAPEISVSSSTGAQLIEVPAP